MISFLLFLFAMYWLPTLIGMVRRLPSLLGIAAVNFFGFTVIAWFVALLWALGAYPAERVVVIEGRARY